MMVSKQLLFSSIILASVLLAELNAQGLETYQWKNRIILLTYSEPNQSLVQEQLQLLGSDIEALEERDIKIFVLLSDRVLDKDGTEVGLNSTEIRKNYSLEGFEGILLLGKDGGIKMKEPYVLEPDSIFDRIDAMPMRKSEMQRKTKID